MTITDFRSVMQRYRDGELDTEQARALLEGAAVPGRRTAVDESGSGEPGPGGTGPRAPVPDGIAVIGMSGQFPGATDVREFWRNLTAGRVGYGELPGHYLDPQRRGYRWGGALSERDSFDAKFFGLRAREADSMSRHQRLLLQESWHALEDAAVAPGGLAGSSTALFVGAEPTGYLHETFTGASDALVASRLSYLLDLHGPALVVNTGCSSSAVALHLACASLRSGESDLALAGGVNAGLDQRSLDLLAESGMLSPTGRCRTFDAEADGTVFAEAVAMLVLKRHADAVADGDAVYGLIRASGMNQDGASNGITAPNGAAQERLIVNVHREHGVDTGRIDYVEAHGTATKLGDPVEANALARAFRTLAPEHQRCVVGSVKSHVGHTGAAAGAVGLIKVLLSMRNERTTGMPTAVTLNPMIEFDGSPFRVDAGHEWAAEPGRPRMAALNSFGHSGTNVHLVLEDVPPAAPRSAPDRPQLVPVSARDPERLRACAAMLADFLEQDGTEHGTHPTPDPAAVTSVVADVLGVDSAELDPGEPLRSLGATPRQLTEVGAALQHRTGGVLSATAVHEARTIDGLAVLVAGAAPASEPASALSLADVAHTLRVGRDAMVERAALVVRDLPELIVGLRSLAGDGVERCWRGRCGSDAELVRLFADDGELDEALRKWLDKGKLDKVAELWVRGVPVDWHRLSGSARRVALPGYPFARNFHGPPVDGGAPSTAEGRVDPVDSPVSEAGDPEPATVDEDAVSAVEHQRPDDGATTAFETGSSSTVEPAEAVRARLAELVERIVGVPAAQVDAEEPLDSYGIDSVARTELNHLVVEAFPAASRTMLFEFAELARVADALIADFPVEARAFAGLDRASRAPAAVRPGAADAQSPPNEPRPPATGPRSRPAAQPAVTTPIPDVPSGGDEDAIAIIGVSGRFPATSDLDSYWDLIVSGRSAIGEVPARRWDWHRYYDPAPVGADLIRKAHSRWGAFIDGFDEFDHEFFGLSEQEARNTDPQVRLFLQESWKALEDAGYAPGTLPAEVRADTGVFAGASKHGFERLGAEGKLELPRTSFGDMVNRVSFQLDLGGPSKPVDTACSSALVALHEAVRSLRSGQCAMALVGGVNLYLHPTTYVELAAVQMLSDRSYCAAFGAGANGIVPGEGVGVVVLKPLVAARRDGDDVQAVIRGSAVNHNGRTIGFTSPSPVRQTEVIRAALGDGGVDPRTVSYVETTANGSEIGDAVEMSALTEVFADRTGADGRFRLGSVKPNIGHGEASSGMAQLIKVLLALRNRTLPPTRTPDEPSRAIDFDRLPFALSETAEQWRPVTVDGVAVPRRAGVTGIGAGGTNAHVVVEEATDTPRTTEPNGRALFVLSARTPGTLEAYVDSWLEFLGADTETDLTRIAYTVQTGRAEMPQRLAVVAEDVPSLRTHLRAWRSGSDSPVVAGSAPRRLRAATPSREDDLHTIAARWVEGAVVDWASLYPKGRPNRLAGLPTYPFDRQTFWIDGAAEAEDDRAGTSHPLLDGAVEPDDDGFAVTGRLSLAAHPWLADHAVQGEVLLPGTAFVEMAVHAGVSVGCPRLEELTLQAPLVLSGADEVLVRLHVGPEDGGTGRRPLEVSSRPADAPSERPWSQHARGVLTVSVARPTFGLAEWPPHGAEPVPVAGYYEAMAEAGYVYGPAFCGLRSVWRRDNEVFAEVGLTPDCAGQADRYGLHPALLDSALHAMGYGEFVPPGGGLVPFSWTGMEVFASGAESARVRLTSAGTSAVRVEVADGEGTPVAELGSLGLRALRGRNKDGDGPRERLYDVDWASLPVDTATGRWRILGEDPFGLTEVFGARPGHGPAHADTGGPAPAVAGFTVLAHTGDDATDATVALAGRVREWLSDPRNATDTLVVATRGAVAAGADEDVPDLDAAPAWGLLRSARSEHPGRLLLVDVDTDSVAALPAAVEAALAAGESEVALRHGIALVPRLVPESTGDALVPPDGPWRLETTGPGTLENLELVPAPEAHEPLGPGAVRVSVRAAGLNFRDVLGALGMYPGEVVLGAEGAGVITETGPDVHGLSPGDRVMGLLPGGFGPVCVTDARTVVPIPRGWSFTTAASVPVAFLTAYYGLVDLAGLGAGETVLVHAAAGGVGTAAVQLGRHLGARVFATASSAKQNAVREAGVPWERIASSRDLDFERTLLESTGGSGMDVVLNSLSGEFVDASLRLLRSGGRFVEMGKTDIRGADQVGDVRYRAFDLVEAGQERIGEILRELVGLFERGVLTPPTTSVRDLRRAPDAFRTMSRGKHVGKLVLTVPRTLDRDGTVLITGGTGTLGGMVAKHLVAEHGARHLLLLSRRGDRTPGAAELVADLRAQGAEVTVSACDAADRDRLAEVVADVPARHPLTAVVHAAGDLDDGVFDTLTPEQFDRVLRPKAAGAWALHELTAEADLAMFVLFSGAAGVFGNPGQANYAAANTFVDALAAHRRARGRPGVSLAWGLWARGSGLTGDLTEQERDRLGRGGMFPLSDEQGLRLFDAASRRDVPLTVPLRMNPAVLRSSGTGPAMLRDLVGARPVGREAGQERESLVERLAGLSAAERGRALLEQVKCEVAAVLPPVSEMEIRGDDEFVDLGFDSLTAVELRNRLDNATGLRLPVTLIFDHTTPGALAEYLRTRLEDRIPDVPDESAHATCSAGRTGEGAGALLKGQDLSRFRAVLALGGRSEEAVAGLAEQHADLIVHRITAEPGEARDAGASGRVWNLDPAREPLPASYDLVLSVAAGTAAADREPLWTRLDAATVDGGRILLVEFVSLLRGDFDDPDTGRGAPSATTWVELLSRARLVVDEVTAAPPLGDDPVAADLVEPTRRGWVVPALLRLHKDTSTTLDERRGRNRERLAGFLSQHRTAAGE